MAFDLMTSLQAVEDSTILVVGSDAAARCDFADLFESEGFATLQAEGAEAADRLVASTSVHLVIFDERASGGRAYGFCRASAVEGRAPIILLSEKTDTVSRIVALEVGADEVLPAPVDRRLLLAQARALLRRHRRPAAQSAPSSGGWSVDPSSRVATGPNGSQVELARHQVRLMQIFLDNAGTVVTAQSIEGHEPAMRLEPAAFRTAMSRLRRRLAPLDRHEFIRIVRGSGYVHGPPPRN